METSSPVRFIMGYSLQMKKLGAAILLIFFLPATLTAEQADSGMSLHPIGTPVSTIITFGDAYANAMEIYDAIITLVEVRRGEKAWELLRKESASNKQPPAGFEYVLARIRFEYKERGKPGDKPYPLSEDQFIAFSSDGATQYPAATGVLPLPQLGRTMHSGNIAEGWVILLVARADRNPFMAFHADVHLLSHTGIGPAFRLY
jgi:hypothetical protein